MAQKSRPGAYRERAGSFGPHRNDVTGSDRLARADAAYRSALGLPADKPLPRTLGNVSGAHDPDGAKASAGQPVSR
jgi:hypothetical protein